MCKKEEATTAVVSFEVIQEDDKTRRSQLVRDLGLAIVQTELEQPHSIGICTQGVSTDGWQKPKESKLPKIGTTIELRKTHKGLHDTICAH